MVQELGGGVTLWVGGQGGVGALSSLSPESAASTPRMPHRTCGCAVNSPHNHTCGKRAVWIFFWFFFLE
jgi:hypothetical protein